MTGLRAHVCGVFFFSFLFVCVCVVVVVVKVGVSKVKTSINEGQSIKND